MSQVILITGANRGIGLALAKELLSKKHRVIATARDPGQAHELKELEIAHGDALSLLPLDVTSDDSVASAVKAVRASHGKLDVLVNNAGLFPEEGNEKLSEMHLAHFREAFETNVIGVVRMVREFLPLLKKGTHSRVVNISSGAGSISGKTDSHYYAYSTSKAALNMATRAMAAELRNQQICVIALTPGWVKTGMGGPSAPLAPEDSARAIAQTIESLTIAHAGQFLERTGTPISEW